MLNYRQNSLTNTPSTHTSVVMSYGESYEELNESLKVNLKLDLNISAFKLNLNGTFGKNRLNRKSMKSRSFRRMPFLKRG